MQTRWIPRPVTAAEFDSFAGVNAVAFGTPVDPEELAIERDVLDLDRTLACRAEQADGTERIVGTTAILSFCLSVPGGELSAAGVTAVGVLPTYRRRGVLTALMHRQLSDVAGRGEPLAVLFASEPGIYRRYGYGPAAQGMALTIPQATARVVGPADDGELVLHPAEEVRNELASIYGQVQPEHPGYYRRNADGWALRLFDPVNRREGATALQAVLRLDAGGRGDGYALYRTKGRFGNTGPDGEVMVSELVAADPAAYAALWRYLLSLDLMARTTATVGLDDPVLHLLPNPYAAGPRLTDNLWVRVVDLPAALLGRRYAAPVDLTMEVRDPLLPSNSGRWRLQADGDGEPSCVRTDAEPDLVLGIDVLGAAYLGGPSLAELARAGQLTATNRAALAAASAAFTWAPRPFCPQLF